MHYSPREILHQVKLNYKDCLVPQSSYVLVINKPHPTNFTQPHALDGIYMRPVTSPEGSHEILHLATNAVITRRNVTGLLPRSLQLSNNLQNAMV